MSDSAKLPKILGGVCEFCGVDASQCKHAKEFEKTGLLKDDARADKFRAVVEKDYEDLPPVVNKNCVECGVPCAGTAKLTDEQKAEHDAMKKVKDDHVAALEAVKSDESLSDVDKDKETARIEKKFRAEHPTRVIASAIAPCKHYEERLKRARHIVGEPMKVVDPDAVAAANAKKDAQEKADEAESSEAEQSNESESEASAAADAEASEEASGEAESGEKSEGASEDAEEAEAASSPSSEAEDVNAPESSDSAEGSTESGEAAPEAEASSGSEGVEDAEDETSDDQE